MPNGIFKLSLFTRCIVSVRLYFQFYLIINFFFHFRPIQLGCFPIFYLLGLQSSDGDENCQYVHNMYIKKFANNKIFVACIKFNVANKSEMWLMKIRCY